MEASKSTAQRLAVGICLAAMLVAAGWLAAARPAAADPLGPEQLVRPPNGLCLTCHDESLSFKGKDGREQTVQAVEAKTFDASAHREVACATCHAGQERLPHADWPALGQPSRAAAVACSECHEDAAEEYLHSPHGTMVELKDTRAPGCADCHGDAHSIQTVKQWSESQRAEACGECHSGATISFTKALRHAPPSPNSMAASYFAGRFLLILTAAVLAFGIIHVELQLLRWLAQKRGGFFRRPGGHGD